MLVANVCEIEKLAIINSEIERKIIENFMPGPLTIVLQKKNIVSDKLTAKKDTVGVRIPTNKIAQEILNACKEPLATSSANLSGKPSPTLGEHVIDDMDGLIDMIIDGGMVGMGLESTIIDVTVTPPMILRPGFITYEMIKEVIGKVDVDKAIFSRPVDGLKPKAPGMKYRHYAPEADYKIFRGDAGKVAEKIITCANQKSDSGHKTGIITVNQHLSLYHERLNKDIIVVSLGDINRPETIANMLFKVLRDFDKADTKFIFGEAFSENNVGWAIMNRLTKAAGYNIIDV